MSKMKVYELAKELDIPSKELIEFLGGKQIEVKSHMSSLEEPEIKMVRDSFAGGSKPAEKPAEKADGEAGGKACGEAGRRGSEEEEYRACLPSPEHPERRTSGKTSGRRRSRGNVSGQADAGE